MTLDTAAAPCFNLTSRGGRPLLAVRPLGRFLPKLSPDSHWAFFVPTPND